MKLRITILKYHARYLCQISLQIMLLPILIWKWNGFNFGWTIRLTLSNCLSVNFDRFWILTNNASPVWKRPILILLIIPFHVIEDLDPLLNITESPCRFWNTMHIIRKLHFALLHYAVEKISHFALKIYYILCQCYLILR